MSVTKLIFIGSLEISFDEINRAREFFLEKFNDRDRVSVKLPQPWPLIDKLDIIQRQRSRIDEIKDCDLVVVVRGPHGNLDLADSYELAVASMYNKPYVEWNNRLWEPEVK